MANLTRIGYETRARDKKPWEKHPRLLDVLAGEVEQEARTIPSSTAQQAEIDRLKAKLTELGEEITKRKWITYAALGAVVLLLLRR